ncbi:MAG: hypothetical protein J6Y48_17895 [Clostridia bacterium]|nr:hypothetical protein [Clostridia bacterium]
MAVQINIDDEALKGCKTYFRWLFEQIEPAKNDPDSRRMEELCGFLFDRDYIFDIAEDGTRAMNATDIRMKYAEKIGAEMKKSERDIDRIRKSIHGKCSALELIFSVCVSLDEMVNEGEEGSMVPIFFRILIKNMGFFGVDCADCMSDRVLEHWSNVLDRFMKREYDADGSHGGMFPVKNWNKKSDKDQRKVPIWYQMNEWLDKNLDEDGYFMVEKFVQ